MMALFEAWKLALWLLLSTQIFTALAAPPVPVTDPNRSGNIQASQPREALPKRPSDCHSLGLPAKQKASISPRVVNAAPFSMQDLCRSDIVESGYNLMQMLWLLDDPADETSRQVRQKPLEGAPIVRRMTDLDKFWYDCPDALLTMWLTQSC